MGFQIIKVTRREQRYRCPSLVRVSPVSLCLGSVVLSTRQIPAVLLRSRKRLASSGAGHGPGRPLHGQVSRCHSHRAALDRGCSARIPVLKSSCAFESPGIGAALAKRGKQNDHSFRQSLPKILRLTNRSAPRIIFPKAMTERDGDADPQRAGGWCEPAGKVPRSYGS